MSIRKNLNEDSEEDLENILDSLNPEVAFTPKRRKMEYKFVVSMNKAINELEIPEEEKKLFEEMLKDYLMEYENSYSRYHKEIKKDREKYLYMLN